MPYGHKDNFFVSRESHQNVQTDVMFLVGRVINGFMYLCLSFF